MPSWVVDQMNWTSDWRIDREDKTVTLLGGSQSELDTAIAKQADLERRRGHFKVVAGWRDELYAAYDSGRRLLLNMERSASSLFGIVTYGIHMTGYVKEADEIKIWVPQRAKNKSTYPSMLDNTVAGGISSGEDPFESTIREAQEEAGLPEAIIRKGARACGTVTYFHIRDERAGGETGLFQPECQYVYDLEVPSGVIPKPEDDEVEQFHLMSVEEVREALGEGKFKPNCAAVMIDFFIRHGILRHDNEKDYIEIVSRLHRRLEFPTP